MSLALPITLTDHPSLVGIIRMPLCTYDYDEMNIPVIFNDDGKWFTATQVVQKANVITKAPQEMRTFTIKKDEVCDFYPYTYYVLTDGESDPLILHPQNMNNTNILKNKIALSNNPIERYYIEGYKGDVDGRVYNITNQSLAMLPTATNEGLSNLTANSQSISQNRNSSITNNTLNAINNVASIGANAMNNGLSKPIGTAIGLVGGVVGGVTSYMSGLETIKQIDARHSDMMLTPSSISSWGTPSTREAFGNNNVKVLRYTVSDVVKNKIRNFNKRYGNKYNSYAIINHKTYKGFIKFSNLKITSGIDNMYINKIREIFERGVYIE